MATPLSAGRFLSALKKAHLQVVEHGQWRTHNRNAKGPWGPVNGVMIHHTGPYSSEAEMVELCRTGYNDLPGPLCHGVIDRNGVVHLVGYGRANHAGAGDPDVLRAVIAEKTLPRDNSAETDGNPRFYGFECINSGDGQTWPKAQIEAMAAAAATVCRAHGWNERSVIGHKEWQPGKPDPSGIDMDEFRALVARYLKGATPDPDEKYASFPGADVFRDGRRSKLFSAVGRRLVDEGFDSYPDGPGDTWNEAHRRSYAAWQIECGYRGKDADGIPGLASWRRLGVPETDK